jgi:hypothetical protein
MTSRESLINVALHFVSKKHMATEVKLNNEVCVELFAYNRPTLNLLVDNS